MGLEPVATAVAIVVSVLTAAATINTLTRRGRLSARLHQWVAIEEKLPDGRVRDDFRRMIESAARSLVQLENPKTRAARITFWLTGSGVVTSLATGGVVTYILANTGPRDPDEPWGVVDSVLLGSLVVAAVLNGAAVTYGRLRK